MGLRGPQVASRAVNVRKSTWQKRKHTADVSMCKRSLRTSRNKCRRRGRGEEPVKQPHLLLMSPCGPAVTSAQGKHTF